MQFDAATRALLTLILLSLLALIVQGLGARSDFTRAVSAREASAVGRYRASAVALPTGMGDGPPAIRLARTDTWTGRVWIMDELDPRKGGVALRESPSPPTDPARDRVLALIEALRDAYPPDFRAWAAKKLGEYDVAVTVPLLVAALDDPDTAMVIRATGALAAAGDPNALPALRELLSHPDPGVRASAQEAIEALE
jgi:hypothetical protein